eukprot:CAMPEP_0113472338 /NCGR_PEP_ID=MMETSP0014_2-20120614/17462_1 /TAXON_ID=2857 /ORGANISM="Nitzschia sp." /LENGTH=332 /DNA_ID=CAMNT_0000365041 /DNA_START=135 /DNA_END=1130 /DNA_ORIENTATION=- /assembly_acc=CAM_ASM_000159
MPFELSKSQVDGDDDNRGKDTSSSSSSSSPPSIDLMKKRLSGFETEVGRLDGLSYTPCNKDEVVITTTPKAGTTWMQQICHQLRSAVPDGGDMDFDEISRVVPWIELAYDQQQDLNADQYGEVDKKPRIFKSHCWQNHCPKFGKTIVVIRQPTDVVVSFYKFFEDWFFEPGSISMDDFADEFWLARGVPPSKMQNASYFVHLVSWYKRLLQQTQNDTYDEGHVMFVCFEDLKDDLERQVRRVARFISTDKFDFDQPDIIKIAVEKSSYEFMKEHSYHFDEKLSKLSRNEACGLPKDAGMKKGKIATGTSKHGSLVLSENIKNKIERKWKEVV